jgi:hypothetical protein
LGRAASQEVALFLGCGVLEATEQLGAPMGWAGSQPSKENLMGRNVTLGIGTLIIILIVVALVF